MKIGLLYFLFTFKQVLYWKYEVITNSDVYDSFIFAIHLNSLSDQFWTW